MFTHPRLQRLSTLLLACLFTVRIASGADPAAPTDPAILKAQVWDQKIVIGPGAYRGTKVVTKTDPKHQVLPGAVVEKTEFATDGHVHWTIDGALFRNCRFHGDLGTHLEAKNTAFEDCMFHKSGGWFVGWAGTKWRFNNCVFTRSFMPASFGVHDYSVRAVDSTFVGVKMPKFGLKTNPAQGVQGGDLQFLRCKFVGCEIPETTLALTIDCTFENCQFDSKKYNWEKAEGPVKVTAYIPSGRVPASYVNTKLSVTFVSGQPPQPAGAKLEHTLAGPRILMPWAQQFQSFHELGSVKKKASEIPVFATAGSPASSFLPPAAAPSVSTPMPPATPLAGVATGPGATAAARPAAATSSGNFSFFNLPPPAPAPGSTAPAASIAAPPPQPPPVVAPATPAVREVRALDELLLVVPLGQGLVSSGRVNPAALEAANAVVDQASAGKPVALRVPFDELVAHRADGYAFKLRGQPQPLSLRGQAVTGRVEVLFRADQAANLSRLGKGSVVPVRGIISKAELVAAKSAVVFTVLIADGVTP